MCLTEPEVVAAKRRPRARKTTVARKGKQTKRALGDEDADKGAVPSLDALLATLLPQLPSAMGDGQSGDEDSTKKAPGVLLVHLLHLLGMLI